MKINFDSDAHKGETLLLSVSAPRTGSYKGFDFDNRYLSVIIIGMDGTVSAKSIKVRSTVVSRCPSILSAPPLTPVEFLFDGFGNIAVIYNLTEKGD